jgi:hypothetical protein
MIYVANQPISKKQIVSSTGRKRLEPKPVNQSLGQIDSDEEESSSQSNMGEEVTAEPIQSLNPFDAGRIKEGTRVKIDISEGGNLKCWVSRPTSPKTTIEQTPETMSHRESKINNPNKVISKKKFYDQDTNPAILEFKDQVNEGWNKSGNRKPGRGKPGRGDFVNYVTDHDESIDNSNLGLSMISHSNAKGDKMNVDRDNSPEKTENLPSTPNSPQKSNSVHPIIPPPLQINLQKMGESGVIGGYKTQMSALMPKQRKSAHMHLGPNR